MVSWSPNVLNQEWQFQVEKVLIPSYPCFGPLKRTKCIFARRIEASLEGLGKTNQKQNGNHHLESKYIWTFACQWLTMIDLTWSTCFFGDCFNSIDGKDLVFHDLDFSRLGSLVLVVYLDLLLHIGHKNVVPMVDLAWQKMRWVGKSVEDPAQCHFRSECFCALKHWLF